MPSEAGQHLQGPGLIPAVPAIVRDMGDGRVLPVQRVDIAPAAPG
jgi:hypothetical protein